MKRYYNYFIIFLFILLSSVAFAEPSPVSGAGGGGSGIPSVSADPTPKLGGSLDLNGYDIEGIDEAEFVILSEYAAVNPTSHGITLTQLTDPGFDGILIWDDVPGVHKYAVIGSGLNFDGTTLTATAAGYVDTTGTINADEIAVFSDSNTLKALTEAEFKTAYNMESGVDYQAYDADLTTYAGITPSANVQSLLGAADYAAMRTQLGLGTVYQYNVGTGANNIPQLSGSPGSPDGTKFLRDDGTWVTPGGSGDVTGVGDCASGACGDGTSDGGTYYRLYDGTANYLELAVSGALGGDRTINLDNLISGLTTQILIGGGAGTNPAWGTDLPTAVTIGSAYIYRSGGTDVPDADVADDITLTNISQITNRAITSLSATNWRLFYSADGGVPVELALGASGTVLKSNGAAAAPTWETDATGGTTAYDDIGDPDANSSIDMTTYTSTFTSAATAGDGYVFGNTAAIGDISVFKIIHSTGNATDGTLLELVQTDTDIDPISVVVNSSEVANLDSSGNLTLSGQITQGATTTPGLTAYDSDAPGADKEIGKMYWNDDGTGGDGTEDGDFFIQAMVGGSETTILSFDNSDAQIEVAVDLNLAEDLEIATGKHITVGSNQWDNGSDYIDGSMIEVDGIDSPQYAAGSIDPEHVASGAWDFGTSVEADTLTEGGVGVPNVNDNLSVFAATTSAQLYGVLSDETGTGSAVFANSPTLVTPNLGIPSSITLTNATGYPAATTSASGISELATTAETTTGTDTGRVVTPDGLSGSVYGQKEIGWTIHDSDDATAVADGKQAVVIPASMNGMNLIDFTCSIADQNSASGGATTVILRRVRAGTPQDMTSTGVTISYNEYTASDEVVDTSYDDVSTGDSIYVDINAVTTGAAHLGLSCTAILQTP